MTFYTFANATTSIPLANLDANFATPITLGNTAVTINGTFSSIGNLTLNNATIASGNSTVTKETVTTITSPAATNLTIQSAGTTAMTIDTSQNVGIGTTSPSAKIDAAGIIRSTSLGGGYPTSGAGLELYYTSNQGIVLAYDRTNSTYKQLTLVGSPIVYSISGTEAARIDSSGNLLVGTTTNTYSTRQVVSGSYGTTIASTYALSSTAVRISYGVGSIIVVRDTVNGGSAVVLYENTLTPIIISQSNAGKYITSGSPTGTQILLANVTSANSGIQASTAAGAGITVSVANINCQN